MTLIFNIGAATDVGQVREVNQDSFLTTDGLAVVADGMGGHRGGEVASAIAVTSLQSSFGEATIDALSDGVQSANGEIRDRAASDPSLLGMGTTLCALAFVEHEGVNKLAIVNVGDSRVYRLDGDRLDQITEDHSLVEALVREGRLTPEEAETHPQRNILTRALGVADSVEVDRFFVDPVAGSRFLLCSDGLFNEVGEDEIARMLGEESDPTIAADHLVMAANTGGGRDNITAVIVDIAESNDTPADESDFSDEDLSVEQARRAITDEIPVVDAVGAGAPDAAVDAGGDVAVAVEQPPADPTDPAGLANPSTDAPTGATSPSTTPTAEMYVEDMPDFDAVDSDKSSASGYEEPATGGPSGAPPKRRWWRRG